MIPTFIVVALTLLSGTAQTQPSPEQMRREGGLKAGDEAPDFELKRRGTDGRVRLSSFRGQKPVALIFGSYT